MPGAVLGGSPHAKLAPFGDIYFGFDFSTQFGYFLSTLRGIDVTSNSYGNSDVDNDGYDAASQEADIIHDGSATTPLFSTGNGAPGFGTATSPQPSAGVAVGASTQFGATGWDSIAKIRQVVDNDVISFSNRGPGATGSTGPDVVADGAYSSGDATLNTVIDGRRRGRRGAARAARRRSPRRRPRWSTRPTSEAHGGSVPGGFYDTARNILKSSAKDLGYDSFTQGAGSVDAGRAVRGGRGQGRDGHARRVARGRLPRHRGPRVHERDRPRRERHAAVHGQPARHLVGVRSPAAALRQRPVLVHEPVAGARERVQLQRAGHLIDLTNSVRHHDDADLMVVRAIFPHDEFDKDANYESDQAWRHAGLQLDRRQPRPQPVDRPRP